MNLSNSAARRCMVYLSIAEATSLTQRKGSNEMTNLQREAASIEEFLESRWVWWSSQSVHKARPHSSLVLISLQWNHNRVEHIWCTTVLRNRSYSTEPFCHRALHLAKQMIFVALEMLTCSNDTAEPSGCWGRNGFVLKTAPKLSTDVIPRMQKSERSH